MTARSTTLHRCIASIGAALVASTALAGSPAKIETRAGVRKEQTEERLVFVTGSLIPQRVRVQKIGTATTSPLEVISRRDIEATGRFTTPGAFANTPSVQVIGH